MTAHRLHILSPLSLSLSRQLPHSTLLHLWNPLRLRFVLRLPAVAGHPWPLLPPAVGPGQRGGDGLQQPVLHGHPGAPEEGGGTAGPRCHFPDPQHLHAGAGTPRPDLPAALAQPRDGVERSALGRRRPGEQVAARAGGGEDVLQPASVPRRHVPGVGVWRCHGSSRLFRAIRSPGESSPIAVVEFKVK